MCAAMSREQGGQGSVCHPATHLRCGGETHRGHFQARQTDPFLQQCGSPFHHKLRRFTTHGRQAQATPAALVPGVCRAAPGLRRVCAGSAPTPMRAAGRNALRTCRRPRRSHCLFEEKHTAHPPPPPECAQCVRTRTHCAPAATPGVCAFCLPTPAEQTPVPAASLCVPTAVVLVQIIRRRRHVECKISPHQGSYARLLMTRFHSTVLGTKSER